MNARNQIFGLATALIVSASGLAGNVFAQDEGAEKEVSSSANEPAIAYPSSNFSWLRHSSTAEEGALRGAAAFVEASGQANYMNSLGAMNYQEAYRRAIENSVNRLEAYYTRRDLWHDHQERYRRKPLDQEGYSKLAAVRTPDRLSSEQYDAETGALRWPFPLDADAFTEARESVEKRLAERSVENAGWGSRHYEMLRRDVEAMRKILEAGRKSLSPDQMVVADSFLDSVLWEGRFVPDAEQLTGAP